MANNFIEPAWTSPEDMEPAETSVELRHVSPFELTGIIVRLLQYQFSDPSNIENESLKEYIWKASDTESRILIKPGTERNPQVRGKPSIFVSRQPVTFDNAGALRRVVIQSGDTTMNDPHYLKHLQGSHMLACEGLTSAEAEAIAWEAANRFMVYSPALCADFKLENIDIKEMGKPELRTEDRETAVWFVPVAIAWQKLHRWRTFSEEVY